MSAETDSHMTRFRWVICSLLFFATALNYIDRAILGILKPTMERDLGWSQVDYGWMVTAFQVTYALGYAVAGGLIDRFGIRLGYFLSVVVWSIAAMAHGGVQSILGFSVARGALGFAEGGSFPAAIKTVAEWHPKEERAFATGLFNAGSNIGAVACPLVAVGLAAAWGWRSAFIVTGAVGFVWVFFWLWLYRTPETHRSVSAGELAYIRKDPPDLGVRVPWLSLLACRQTWAFVVGMAASSPIWWFYIYWTPDFLDKRYHLDLTQSSVPLMLVFLAASLGGVGGGWLSSKLLKSGRSVNAARKTAFLICALCVVPVYATPLVREVWAAMALVSLAAAAHCGFAANLFTLVSDTMPREVVSSVVGIGGMAAAFSGMVFAQLVSRILQLTNNNYAVPFAVASLSYLTAVIIMHILLPHMEQMKLPASEATQSP
jgi:MFS transporter, ACS family, hexuronate transporter